MDVLQLASQIRPLDDGAMDRARERQHSLAKPAGSFGLLEQLSIQIAGITGKVNNRVDKKVHFLFGADNGVYEEGVAGTPQHFTNLLMQFYGGSAHCGINVLCDHNGIDLRVIDLGVKGELDLPHVENRKLMPEGTHNFCKQPAMEPEVVSRAVEIGFCCAQEAIRQGYQIIGTGEVGMANTTTAAACIMAALEIDDPDLAVGRGAGLTDEAFARKKQVILRGLRLHNPDSNDAFDILSKVGGLDIAAMCGLFLGAAYCRVPVVVDGVISVAAALLAAKINPLAKCFMIPSHISEEPGYKLAVQALGLTPMLNLGMRLGEGTGCPLAMLLVENALVIMNEMSTFEEANLETDYRKNLKV